MGDGGLGGYDAATCLRYLRRRAALVLIPGFEEDLRTVLTVLPMPVTLRTLSVMGASASSLSRSITSWSESEDALARRPLIPITVVTVSDSFTPDDDVSSNPFAFASLANTALSTTICTTSFSS